MKRLLPLMVVLCCPLFALCQDITGLWKGTMYSETTNQTLDYEIVIKKEKGKYTAYSHTWYIINDQKYYGVKKINVRIAKDGKIVMQDASLVGNNYPIPQHKDVIQLNVLDLNDVDNQATLKGLFVTNTTKNHKAFTGRIDVTRVNPQLTESALVAFLQKSGDEGSLTLVK